MPPAPKKLANKAFARDVMLQLPTVTMLASQPQVAAILNESQHLWFPVVDCSGHLLGEMEFCELQNFVDHATSCSTMQQWVDTYPQVLRHNQLTADPLASLLLLHRMFQVLGPSVVYITDKGKLQGSISKYHLCVNGYSNNFTDTDEESPDDATIDNSNKQLHST